MLQDKKESTKPGDPIVHSKGENKQRNETVEEAGEEESHPHQNEVTGLPESFDDDKPNELANCDVGITETPSGPDKAGEFSAVSSECMAEVEEVYTPIDAPTQSQRRRRKKKKKHEGYYPTSSHFVSRHYFSR